ncbi:hypothetical protein HDZ31DRAFT_67304, partial [Schizophyllum fasciatum]
STTFDSDAASLDAGDLAQIAPAELARLAREEEARAQKEERRRRRRERREMRRVADAIAAGALEGHGNVNTQPMPAAGMSASRRLSIDAFGPFQQAPGPAHDEADEADAADLDGGLYAGRRCAHGGSSVSGSSSRTSASQHDSQAPPPAKEKRKKAKSGSGKASNSSKSSRSRASDTSASTAQSPSLVSPHASSFAGMMPSAYAMPEDAMYVVPEDATADGEFDGIVGMGLDSAPAAAYTSAELKPSAGKWGSELTVNVNGLTPSGGLPSAALATGMPSPGLGTVMPSPGLSGGPRRQANARDLGAFLASK